MKPYRAIKHVGIWYVFRIADQKLIGASIRLTWALEGACEIERQRLDRLAAI